MKKILITLITLLFVITFAKADDVKFFPAKNGIIQYKMTGFMEGTQTAYFEDYGQKYVIEQDMLYFGAQNKSKTFLVRDSSYSVDLLKNVGYKFLDPEKTNYIRLYKEANDPNKAYQELYKSLGGKMIGKEKIKKVECEVWEMSLGLRKVWLGDGIIYKIQLIESGKTGTIELTQIDYNIAFEKEFFKKPAIVFTTFGTTQGK